MPCSGRPRLCAELCLLLSLLKKINPAVVAAGGKAWECELSCLQKNKQKRPTRQISKRSSHGDYFEMLGDGGRADGAQLVPAWPEVGPGLRHRGASTRGAVSCPSLFSRAAQANVPQSRTVSPVSPAALGERRWWLNPPELELCQPFVSHTWLTAETVTQQNPRRTTRLPSLALKDLGMIHSSSACLPLQPHQPEESGGGMGEPIVDPVTHPCPSCTFRTPQPRVSPTLRLCVYPSPPHAPRSHPAHADLPREVGTTAPSDITQPSKNPIPSGKSAALHLARWGFAMQIPVRKCYSCVSQANPRLKECRRHRPRPPHRVPRGDTAAQRGAAAPLCGRGAHSRGDGGRLGSGRLQRGDGEPLGGLFGRVGKKLWVTWMEYPAFFFFFVSRETTGSNHRQDKGREVLPSAESSSGSQLAAKQLLQGRKGSLQPTLLQPSNQSNGAWTRTRKQTVEEKSLCAG